MGGVLLYDGGCGLCQRSVQFVLARDRRGQVQFAALGSAAAQRVLAGAVASGPWPDSVLFVQGGVVHTRSTAVVRLLGCLDRPWPWVGGLLRLVPRWLRDRVYAWVAARRSRWAAAGCLVPTPALRERFLDAGERVRP